MLSTRAAGAALAALTLSFLTVCLSANADPPASPIKITAEPVDPGIFYLVAYRAGNAPPSASPFVVEKTGAAWLPAVPTDAADLTIKAKSGIELSVKTGGSIRLQDASGNELISAGTVAAANGATILTLTHDPRERFYGAGNESENHAGDLFFQQTQTEWDGWRAAMSDKRAWEINRAFAPGIQRFGAATWTGDINSDWETLANQPGTLLNWSLAGMPYVGQDIGGFQGLPSPELYTRWIEEGVFVPVMRAHGTFNSPRWPWAFGDDALAAIKKSIELRYRLIPYYYSFAAQTTASGAPLMRPLVLEYSQDPKTFNLEDEWLVGDRLLAAPVLTPGGARSIYLPSGEWFDFNAGTPVAGGQTVQVQAPLGTIPAYVRAGSILPLGPVIQSTSLGVEDPMEIRIYPGADADFSLYEDDGDTYAYEKGESSRIPMHWDDTKKRLTVGKRRGSFPAMLGVRHLNAVLPDGTSKSATYDGGELRIEF